MQKITLLSVGKVKTMCFAEGGALYAQRLEKQCDFSERILAAGTKEEENDRMLKALRKTKGAIVVLSHRGKEFSSEEFAAWIGRQRDIGSPVTFVISGAYGADERVLAQAHLVLSLSRMTLPHELCRLVFLEQLYRAGEILKGGGYHH